MLINGMKIFSIIILIISLIIGIIKILNSTNIFKTKNNISEISNNTDNNIIVEQEDSHTNNTMNNNIITNRRNENKDNNISIDKYYDLIIVGAGLSGLTAAFEASKLSNNSLKILLLETSSNYGGNANNEIDGINVLMPSKKFKGKEKAIDNFTSFYDDSFEVGRYLNEKDLLTILVNNSYEIYNFLFNELNCNSLKLIKSEGSKVPRTLIYDNEEMTTGKYLSDRLYNKIKNISSIDISFNSHFIDIIVNNDYTEVKGIIYEFQEGYDILNKTVYSKAIILATGGYGSDFYAQESLLKEFLIQYYHLPTFSTKNTQGIGIKMGRNKGAVLIDQREAETYPTCFVDLSDRYNRHKILAPDLFRELGGILVNKRGKRFCNEMGKRRYVSQSILKNCDIVTDPNIIKQYEGFLIINEEIKENYGEKIDDYISKGYLKKYKSFDEFCKDMNISEYYVNIRKSIMNYNQGYDKSWDNYGKNKFPTKFKMGDTIYVGVITPCIFHTFGGVRISEKAEILNEGRRPIKGFFATGQVIGGIHGANSMQGNILTHSLVFGRLVAKTAVNYLK